ncbi:MAG: hypothetical protein ACJA1A_003566 [Saprospiraceae bacterium]|jgi:hypothetical protein|tara:strand:- start:652 stop:1380 length:729 start_codon:yes stop_codon:yes gene_type:complete
MCSIIAYQSCTHDPFLIVDIDPEPMDTMVIDTMVIDTMDIDTTNMGTPCDPDIIYFTTDILPILLGSCAISGCHDAATATEDVILDNYDNVINTAKVKPFDLSDSELYEVITEDDPDKIMPPTGKLDNAKISLIAQWILEGAKNLECDEETGGCVTENISYTGFVKGILNTSCIGCHSTAAASGGVILDTYAGVKTVVNNNRLYGAINWDIGFQKMPQGQDKLDDCKISKIKSWIDDGAQNN